MSATLLAPWESRVSRLAGLPTDRAAWLAIVLPPMLTEPSYPRATDALAALGYTLPRWTLAGWAQKLSALHAARDLPEAPDGIPERRPSGRAWRAAQGVPVESRGPRSAPAPKRPRKATKRKRASATAKRAAAKKLRAETPTHKALREKRSASKIIR